MNPNDFNYGTIEWFLAVKETHGNKYMINEALKLLKAAKGSVNEEMLQSMIKAILQRGNSSRAVSSGGK